MSAKTALLYLFLVMLYNSNAYGQDNEFCEAVNTIANDAPNKFRNIRGHVMGDNPNATMWSCEIKVPGTINSRFVSSQGLFYEGAVFQSQSKDELQAVYDKYKKLLTSCLSPLGYHLSEGPNFSFGLGQYRKLVFMQEPKEDIKPENAPAHITMEALFSKEIGLYTIVFYIFEH